MDRLPHRGATHLEGCCQISFRRNPGPRRHLARQDPIGDERGNLSGQSVWKNRPELIHVGDSPQKVNGNPQTSHLTAVTYVAIAALSNRFLLLQSIGMGFLEGRAPARRPASPTLPGSQAAMRRRSGAKKPPSSLLCLPMRADTHKLPTGILRDGWFRRRSRVRDAWSTPWPRADCQHISDMSPG